ncbi:hypothetical protein OFO10_03125 [Campylobacter sp. VBCF_06 NA8]|uniref:hypothetical protein n=1 Tax=Campylobacter sp. VBCF_06 NA8 TaxID=2983822 RepID=UPI0022E9EC27|nr:hypothetical protein [Campylobacter sp. VBCF_06 NA8]MDA3046144.1 hypothetical protein [Campylobacter sp. VBCF_06 NA8]
MLKLCLGLVGGELLCFVNRHEENDKFAKKVNKFLERIYGSQECIDKIALRLWLSGGGYFDFGKSAKSCRA